MKKPTYIYSSKFTNLIFEYSCLNTIRLNDIIFLLKGSLQEILEHFRHADSSSLVSPENHEPVLVYTMRRIAGADLAKTSLKSLGLMKGKAMFR